MSVVDNESDKKFKLKEIIDMLVVGGYFRARMPALTPFDRGPFFRRPRTPLVPTHPLKRPCLSHV
jgi:hypothetical protein